MAGEKQTKEKRTGRPAHRTMWLARILCAIAIATGLYFAVRYWMNAAFLRDYRDGIYNEQTEEPLLTLNFVQPYLPYYNIANVCYQKDEFDVAIAFYREALEMNPNHPEECSIRVNLALSMLQKIDFSDVSSTKKIEGIIRQLLAARAVLTEEDCANPETDEGHSAEAEQLKKDIDEMIEQLREMLEEEEQPQQQQQQQQTQQQQQQQQEMSAEEQQIQQQLQEQMQQALQEHADAENAAGYGGGYEGYGGGNNGAMW